MVDNQFKLGKEGKDGAEKQGKVVSSQIKAL